MKKRLMPQRIASICMALVLAAGITGCGEKKSDKAPDLVEPVSTNEAYRPVTYGDIGRKVIKTGTIVPTDYCYYYDTSVTLSKVYVNVGDEIKSDTVLAETDDNADSTDDASGDGSDGADDSSLMDDGSSEDGDSSSYAHDIKQKIYEQNQAELDWKIKACEEIKDEEGAAQARTEKAVNEENNRYDNILYEYQQKKLQQADEDKEKTKQSGTLKAQHPGYVTYAKKISGNENTVNGGENVVVVSDYDQPYIEITGETYKKSSYDMYKNMYTVIDGKQYDIEPFKYSNQEIAVAQSMSSLPYTRFQLKGVKNPEKLLKVGNTVSLYFSTSDAKHVLTVGNDSLYEENGQYFVYVKTESSEKERRNVEIGVKDSNYTEIESGLKEGELVYYASDAVMPSDYSEYTVSLDSYTKTDKSTSFSVEDLNSVNYTAPCDGRFSELNVKKGSKVKKGDVLFVLDSGGGTAAVKDIDNQIEDENQSYNSEMKDYDDQMNELTKEITHYQKDKLATPTDAENTLYMAEQLVCQRNVISYNKDLRTYNHNQTLAKLNAQREKLNKNNDGSGKISVYADQDGTVISVDASTDAAVKEGQSVLTVGSNENVIMALSVSEGKLAINQKVTIVNKSNSSQKISGVCVGTTGDSSKSYIETDEDGNVHVTKSSGSDDLKYYIKVDDSKFYKKPKSYQVKYPTMSYENVVMIPNNMIYHETSKMNSSEYDYVWLIKDGEIIKQYITLGEVAQNKTIILSGLSEGDVIAKESAARSVGGASKSDDSASGNDNPGDSGSSDSSADSSASDSSSGADDGSDMDNGGSADDGSADEE